jgi:hypothetical protein
MPGWLTSLMRAQCLYGGQGVREEGSAPVNVWGDAGGGGGEIGAPKGV